VGKQTRPFDERHDEERQRPGNRPSEQQERDPKQIHRTQPRSRAVSGPGAADFLASSSGEDLPGSSAGKGMSNTREQSDATNPRELVPRLGPDTEAHPGEREPDEERGGSATGRIGGGGADAHNPSPVRATGVDDESVTED
jgi:hypothetical protein